MVVFILGPTASGKTKVSIELAKKIGGEVVGADSVQIYRDLVIGAASPTIEEREGIPHHLIGIYELKDEINAGIYIDIAVSAIDDIKSRGKIPIVVGGTNFYVDALINGLSPVPELDSLKRKEFNTLLEKFSTEELFAKLLTVDSEWATQISSPNDRQRIGRGLEVFELTGKKLSEWNKLSKIKKFQHTFLSFAIEVERETLYQKINNRSETIVKSGLVEEVKRVNKAGFNTSNCNPLNSIGYLQADQFLKGIISDEDELVLTIARDTRHLAKRQMTWLKKRSYLQWGKADSVIEAALRAVPNICHNVSKN
ncbi:MAG: tRNA (adenosine(37)-N6)-dimethylallyltransferase MiaA [bacterium]